MDDDKGETVSAIGLDSPRKKAKEVETKKTRCLSLFSPPKNTHGKRGDVLLHPGPGVQHVRAKVPARPGGGEGPEEVEAAEQADGLGELLRRRRMLRLSLSGGGIASCRRRRRGVAVHACFKREEAEAARASKCWFRFFELSWKELEGARERERES